MRNASQIDWSRLINVADVSADEKNASQINWSRLINVADASADERNASHINWSRWTRCASLSSGSHKNQFPWNLFSLPTSLKCLTSYRYLEEERNTILINMDKFQQKQEINTNFRLIESSITFFSLAALKTTFGTWRCLKTYNLIILVIKVVPYILLQSTSANSNTQWNKNLFELPNVRINERILQEFLIKGN